MVSKVTELQRSADVPEKIGKYVIINKIGKGSTGMVYLSHDPYYRRDVAIKVYNTEEDADAEKALSEVVNRFPETTAARLATQRLNQLKSGVR